MSSSPDRTSDYARMSMSSSSSSFSLCSLLKKIHRLPWVAERVTVDYIPGNRSHVSGSNASVSSSQRTPSPSLSSRKHGHL